MGNTAAVADIVTELRLEFIEDATDRIEEVYAFLNAIERDPDNFEEALRHIRRHVHSLKGQAAAFEFPSITRILHSLEDYLETAPELGPDIVEDMRVYINSTREILESGADPGGDDVKETLSKMPITAQKISDSQDIRDIPALLVMPKGTQRSLVGKELASCGFRVVTADDPIEAIRTAIDAEPDFIIVNRLLAKVSGAELANVFQAIETLAGCRVILLTSDEDLGKSEPALPADAKIVHKGPAFFEELTDQLIDWGLFGAVH